MFLNYFKTAWRNLISNKVFGWKVNDTVGKTIISMDETKQEFTIIGVIKDYHFTS